MSGSASCPRQRPPAPTRIQDFLVAQNAHDLFMGGIGYALNDDLHVAWTRSGAAAGHYPTSYAAYQAADAPNNTISNRAVVAAGTAPYNGERWGDYVGVAQDPQVPNAVWDGNQYAGGPGFNNWSTEVTQLQTGGSSYVPIPPVRVLDTRPAFQIGLSGPFVANVPRTFQVSGGLAIPADAVAVTGNVTITNQTAGGYLSVTPTAVANPTSSTINFPLGDTRANNLTVPLSADGKLAAVFKAPAGKTTHLIVDITGYFLAGNEDFDLFDPAAGSRPRLRPGDTASRHVQARHPTDPQHRRRQRHPGRGQGDHRQPDRRRPDTRRLPLDHTRSGLDPGDLDAELPPRRHAGQRCVGAAQRDRRPVDRVQGIGWYDPRHPRRDRLLPRGSVRPALLPADAGPGHGHSNHPVVGPVRTVLVQHAASARRRRPLGCAAQRRGRDRQPHGRRPAGRRLRVGDPQLGGQPDDVGAELPARRHPGERRDPAAQRRRPIVVRLQGAARQS